MRDRIDRIETLIHQDVGRGVTALFDASRGGLWNASSALTETKPRRIGLLTGFFVPLGDPPAAETDGPAGAALLALAFSRIGVPCRMLTDTACAAACRAALDGAGVLNVTVDAVAPDAPLDTMVANWRALGIDWMIAVERCGLAADGRPRNMRGEDVGAHAAPLDRMFVAGPWRTIAIGDGGNEVGMGALPAGLIAAHVPFGATIGCATPADHLIVAGVSHWGIYALIAAMAVRVPGWRTALMTCLTPAIDRAILKSLVDHGPAVDGVTLRQTLTIDGLDLAAHRRKLEAVREIVEGPGKSVD